MQTSNRLKNKSFLPLTLLLSLVVVAMASSVSAQTQPKKIVIGPGGRPLRTTYPGTAKSLQSSTLTKDEASKKKKAEENVKARERVVEISEIQREVRSDKARILLADEAKSFEGTTKPILYARFQNDILNAYLLESIAVSLDGTSLYHPEQPPSGEKIPLFHDKVAPIPHQVVVTATFTKRSDVEESVEISATCNVNVKPGRNTFLSISATIAPDINLPQLTCAYDLRDFPSNQSSL